jgi:hypothetical protein
MQRVLKWAFVINLAVVFMTNFTFMFCIPHPNRILSTPTGIPYIQLFLDATQSLAGAGICVVKILADLGFAGVSEQGVCISTTMGLLAKPWSTLLDPLELSP